MNLISLVPIVCGFLVAGIHTAQPTIQPTSATRAFIYIHGTLIASTFALNPFKRYQQSTVDHSLYDYTLTTLRMHPLYYEDHLMGPLGLTPINLEAVRAYSNHQFTPINHWLGIIPVISTIESLNIHQESYAHYSFGWSGALSWVHRQQAGFALYFDLLELQQANPKMPLTLICHSHGGNVAAYLALAEAQFKGGLQIDSLIMFGTPIQYETVNFFANKIFKLVVNCYSMGDRIQGKDAISVPSKKSYKQINKVLKVAPPNCIVEAAMVVNNNKQAIGHREMFALKKYYIPANPLVHGPHHHFFRIIDPMPICVFGPTLEELVNSIVLKPGLHQTVLHFVSSPMTVSLQLDFPTRCGISSRNVYPYLTAAQRTARLYWEPYASTSDFVKAWHASKIAFGRPKKKVSSLKVHCT